MEGRKWPKQALDGPACSLKSIEHAMTGLAPFQPDITRFILHEDEKNKTTGDPILDKISGPNICAKAIQNKAYVKRVGGSDRHIPVSCVLVFMRVLADNNRLSALCTRQSSIRGTR